MGAEVLGALPVDVSAGRGLGVGLQEMLLAAIADSLRWLQWAKTKDGARGRICPEPIRGPGIGP